MVGRGTQAQLQVILMDKRLEEAVVLDGAGGGRWKERNAGAARS
jgi:hypothetical protein